MQILKRFFVPLTVILGLSIMTTGCGKKAPKIELTANLPTQEALWTLVKTLVLTVTADDITTETHTRDIKATDTEVIFSLTITDGNDRLFTLDAKDSLGVVLFWGEIEIDLEKGETYNLEVDLVPVDTAEGKAEVNLTINFPDPVQYPLWNDVCVLILTVTAQDMDAVCDTQDVTVGDTIATFTLDVKDGNDRLVTLDAKDSLGVVLFWGRIQVNLEAGETYDFDIEIEPAGGGAANHIKIFRDGLPWTSSAMDTMLQREGFTPGSGENQYEILTSDDFATVSLTVGEDMVIIVNDQDQNFYNNYAASQTKFDNFVFSGGLIFWEACDRGWASGSILDAGITFPGGVSVDTTYIYDYYNLLYNPDYELVSGLPDTLYGTYASHETFTGYPQGTQIFTVNRSEGKPTLILYHYGVGWVTITGQPLEHGYDHGFTMGELLPRVVRFFLGKPPVATKGYYPAGVSVSPRKSSGSM